MIRHLLITSMIGQMASFLCSLLYIKTNKDLLAKLAKGVLALSWLLITFVILLKWVGEDRPPFKTLHESLILLAWCIHFTGFLSYFSNKYPLFWSFVGVTATAALLYALVHPDLEKVFLPPALQSIWFVPHVVVYFIGYSALILGTVGLLSGSRLDKILGKVEHAIFPSGNVCLLYNKILRIGALFLMTGLILGAIWADEAWGIYWGWDPKESWALITFLLYGGYLHFAEARQKANTGKLLLLLGMGSILFTYLGMHLLPTADGSLHVYQ